MEGPKTHPYTVWMNSNKHPALADWHRYLYDWESLMDIPSMHRAELKRRADWMLQAGVIDLLEHWDMCTLAMAAESHALESKIDDFLKASYQYNLVAPDGTHGGYMDGYAIYFEDSMAMHDRAVCRRGEHHFRIVAFYGSRTTGHIIHDTMTVDGRAHPTYKLAPRSHRIKGEIVPI